MSEVIGEVSDEQEVVAPERLSDDLSAALLAETKFEGDENLKRDLEHFGLEPRYGVELDGGRMALSAIYEAVERDAVVAYVQAGETPPVARTLYQSKSSGMWRVLPEYTRQGEEISWLGKGYGEDSLNVPFEVQKKLAEIKAVERKSLAKEDGELIFSGLAKGYESSAGLGQGAYYQEVEKQAADAYGSLAEDMTGRTLPESMEMLPDKQPKLEGEPELRWKDEMEMYGEVEAEVWPSEDGTMRYLFFRNENNKVWIGGIEMADAELTSMGVKKEWVAGGDLTTPAYEYPSQAGSWGNPMDNKEGYTDVSLRYLRKLPPIAEFRRKENI